MVELSPIKYRVVFDGCGHVWAKRSRKVKRPPGTCPNCKSALWDVPRNE